MLNQEVHKNLRRNKTGIRVDQIENLSPTYKRPPGFTLLPTLLNASMQNKSLDKNAKRHFNYMDAVQPKSKITPSIAKKMAPKSPAALDSAKSAQIYSKPLSKNDMLRWGIMTIFRLISSFFFLLSFQPQNHITNTHRAQFAHKEVNYNSISTWMHFIDGNRLIFGISSGISGLQTGLFKNSMEFNWVSMKNQRCAHSWSENQPIFHPLKT